jgi:hypothetical protein
MPTKSAGKKTPAVKHSRKPMRGGGEEDPRAPITPIQISLKPTVFGPGQQRTNSLDSENAFVSNEVSDAYLLSGEDGTQNAAPAWRPESTDLKKAKIKEMMMNDRYMPNRMKTIKNSIEAMLEDVIAGKPREQIDFGAFMPFYQKYIVAGDSDKDKTKFVQDMYDFIVDNVHTTDRSFALCRLSKTVQKDLQTVYKVEQLDKLLSEVRDKVINILDVDAEAQKKKLEGGGKKKPARRTAKKAAPKKAAPKKK